MILHLIFVLKFLYKYKSYLKSSFCSLAVVLIAPRLQDKNE